MRTLLSLPATTFPKSAEPMSAEPSGMVVFSLGSAGWGGSPPKGDGVGVLTSPSSLIERPPRMAGRVGQDALQISVGRRGVSQGCDVVSPVGPGGQGVHSRVAGATFWKRRP